MFALSLSTTTNNKVSANEAPNCFDFTLSCGVTGEYCPAQNQSIQSIVDDIWWLDGVICG